MKKAASGMSPFVVRETGVSKGEWLTFFRGAATEKEALELVAEGLTYPAVYGVDVAVPATTPGGKPYYKSVGYAAKAPTGLKLVGFLAENAEAFIEAVWAAGAEPAPFFMEAA